MVSRALKEEEVDLIVKRLSNPKHLALFVLGLKTGFRISELLSLTVSDVYNGSVKSSITVKRCNMKGKHISRTVPLHPLAKQTLKTYIGVQATTDPNAKLFPFTRMQAWRILKEAGELIGITKQISTHSMRKTFGMNVYHRTGKNVVAAQRALGHVSLASTSHYLSIGQDEIDEAILA